MIAAVVLCMVTSSIATDVWPLPSSATGGSISLPVDPSGTDFFKWSGASNPLINAAFERYSALCFPHTSKPGKSSPKSLITHMVVSADDQTSGYPTIDTDESYQLLLSPASAKLNAKTVFGVLRGLETFSQLVMFDYDSEAYQIEGGPWTISDSPRFAHRGLMIDTARHFQVDTTQAN